jgi:hypothetical protein
MRSSDATGPRCDAKHKGEMSICKWGHCIVGARCGGHTLALSCCSCLVISTTCALNAIAASRCSWRATWCWRVSTCTCAPQQGSIVLSIGLRNHHKHPMSESTCGNTMPIPVRGLYKVLSSGQSKLKFLTCMHGACIHDVLYGCACAAVVAAKVAAAYGSCSHTWR